MTRFGPTARRVRADDALLDSLARRDEPPADADSAVRLLADLSVAADASSPGLGRYAPEGARFVATSERGGRPSIAWAAAAAAAAVVAVALGTVAPPSSPRPVPTVEVSPVAPVALTRARTLIDQAQSLLGPAGSLVSPAVRSRARALLTEARVELERARAAQEGALADRDEVGQSLVRAETSLAESERRLDGRDDETSDPSPTSTGSDEDEPKSESDNEKSTGDEKAADEGQTPKPDERTHDD